MFTSVRPLNRILPLKSFVNLGKMSSSTKTVHPTSLNSFNSNHSLYDRVRPDFDPQFVTKFLGDLGLVSKKNDRLGEVTFNNKKDILELAAGTGKFTKKLIAAGWSSTNLKIIEPSVGMIESFQKNFPQVDAKVGSSYEIPLEDSSVDAVIVAQGFHWFSDKNSLQEISRVLKPNGKLGLIWNFDSTGNNSSLAQSGQDLGLTQLEIDKKYGWEKIAKLAQDFDDEVPQYRKGEWRTAFQNQSFFKNDSVCNQFIHRFEKFDVDLVYDYWLSRSYITKLPDNEKAKLKAQQDELISQLPDASFVEGSDKKQLNQFLGSEYFVITPNK
ncbi:putative methyltransferase [Wickerhamomyces ciferrii]|uniref:Methyltransferase n=1 Tax=Wickerhamomyces ciferrii (strain ATCC 14091 / BCRC 22168 / CBS 111 / JCM 3599 / NBRC 0793 / NRRL Y-1031 F-60-10) TaxID=1206466 RepID=K0L0I5_WICCF|nr:putative methyltransferase [Wickerhamomyces ciferrii]CCH46948.1 putative methyltransferase [Wickerhamomyces ciferrii]